MQPAARWSLPGKRGSGRSELTALCLIGGDSGGDQSTFEGSAPCDIGNSDLHTVQKVQDESLRDPKLDE